MAKKRKRVDYDSPLMSIYSPEYQYLMRQNAPENANIAGLGDWFSNLFRRNKQQPDYHRDTVSMGLGTENSLQGIGNGGTDWNNQDFSLTGQSNQQQFNYDPNQELTTSQQHQNTLKDPENLAPKQTEQPAQPSAGSNVNWGGVIGTAATATANAISNGGSAADIAANAMGIPVLAKIWKANTEKGDANIKSAQEAIDSVQDNKYIQDANSLQGAGNALKLNMSNKPKMIDTSGFQRMTNWKDFSSGRGSGTWWKNMATAQFQGAAAGSVGGPWGALGGATAGLLGSIGGLFGAKKRAKRAMNEYNQRMDSLRAYATAENLRRKADYELSNQNAIHNGLGQQSIKEMSNFRAFGGNLYPDGGTIEPYYPESSDPDTVNWLSDWYRQRPNQVQNTFGNSHNLSFAQIRPNMNESYYGEDNVPPNRRVYYDLLTYPTEEEYNKNLYKNLIDRAAASSNIFSENMWEGAGGTYSNDGTHFIQNPNFDPNYNDWLMQQWKAGNYVNMDESKNTPETLISGDNYKNTIMYNWKAMNERNDAMSTRVHERTHSMVTDPLLNSLDIGLQNAINSRVKLKENFNREHYGDNDAYWDDPNEIYSRMNEFRYKSGLKGSDKVTKEFLNENRKLLEDKGLDRYTDESLLKLFNEIADNNNMGNYSNIAAMGGQFDINLSPNMMNLWNDKQNIDKQKLMNQQMNFGLGNSFNTKLNTFDYGGSMNGMNLPTNMQYYENGGTHEENPNGGIQVGQDQQGNPNLVEEGEFRYGDYIFSDRIPVDYSILSDFNVEKGKSNRNTKNNPTYAELAKKTADKYKDLNDKISKDSLNKQLDRLQQSQEAQKFKEQQDQQYADYTSALKNPTQGNPMYGSMKYNGMGNANQGVNAGVDEGMGNPMDNSDLSNVNRSGNPMMAAYGGNLFGDGGRPVLHGKIFPTKFNPYGDSQLGIIDKNNDINGYGLPIKGTQYLTYTGLVDYPTRDNNEPSIYDLNPPKTQNLGDASAYGYNTATKDDYNKLNIDVPFNPSGMVGNVVYSRLPFNRPELAGVNTNFNPITNPTAAQKQQLLVNNGYDLDNTGFYGDGVDNAWGKKSQEAWSDFTRKYGSTQNNQASNSTYSSDKKSVKGEVPVNQNSSKSETGEVTNSTKTNSSANDVVPVENLGEVNKQQGNLADSSPFDWNRYNEAGRYGTLAKGLVPNLMNWAGQTNWNYDPNWKPSNELEALGHSSYANRTADHLGDYIAPNLMDLERLNNAAMAQTAAQQRGIQNISGGNRGFVAAQGATTDYNGQMGIGNNYVTAEQYNADQKQRAAEFNRATNQFNAQANNDMYRDNLNAWMQGRQMDIQAMEAANRERQFERQYKDKVDRDAALNKQKDLAAMFDNTMNFLADEAEYNRRLNDMNSRRNNRFWYDKKEGWQERNDNGFTSKLNDAISGAILSSDDFNQISKIQNNDKYTDNEKIAMIQNIADSARARNKQENDAIAAEKKKEIQNYLSEAQSYFNLLNGLQGYQPWENAKNRYSDPNYFTYTDDLSKEIAKHRMDELQNMWFNYTTRYNPNAVEEVPTPQTGKTGKTRAYGGKLKRKREYDYMSI